jgi:dephospho-CoA kinase
MTASKTPLKIGLAGGIGSGKSYVARLLARHGISVYDCDNAAKRLMRSEEIQHQLEQLIGCKPDKQALTRFLLASDDNAKAINAIVHPAVFRDFEESGFLWLESGIMFESGANHYVDRVVVVTAPEEIRIQRIMQRDNISREQAHEWMQRQWPQERVRQMADYEIINDGLADVDQQITHLLGQLDLLSPLSS